MPNGVIDTLVSSNVMAIRLNCPVILTVVVATRLVCGAGPVILGLGQRRRRLEADE